MVVCEQINIKNVIENNENIEYEAIGEDKQPCVYNRCY